MIFSRPQLTIPRFVLIRTESSRTRDEWYFFEILNIELMQKGKLACTYLSTVGLVVLLFITTLNLVNLHHLHFRNQCDRAHKVHIWMSPQPTLFDNFDNWYATLNNISSRKSRHWHTFNLLVQYGSVWQVWLHWLHWATLSYTGLHYC